MDRLKLEAASGVQSIQGVGAELGLTTKQTNFAIEWLSGKYPSTSQAAMVVYKCSYANARVYAHSCMHNKRVQALMDIIFVKNGLTGLKVDKEFAKLIAQDVDLKTKAVAIKLFYEMTGAFQRRLTVTLEKTVDPSILTIEQLEQIDRESGEIADRFEDADEVADKG